MLMTGCSPQTYQHFDYNKSSNPWIDAFKDQVFFSCLREGYKSDSLFNAIEKKDALNPYDGLELEALNLARSLGKTLVKNMQPPSMCDGCKTGMNYYMANALHYYNSKELDSIAHKAYKKHIAGEKDFDAALKK